MPSQRIIEIIGISAVVLSLIFVGLELRQTSSIARVEVLQSFTADLSELSASISHDTELSAALEKILFPTRAMKELTVVEHIKLRTFIVSELYLMYGLFLSTEEGVLSEENLSLINSTGLLNTDYFRDVWPTQKHQFSSTFVNFLESLSWNSK